MAEPSDANPLDTILTIGLLWHSITSDNLGVGALTISQMVLITEAAHRCGKQVRFIVFSPTEEVPYSIKEFDVYSVIFSKKAFMSGRFDAITHLKRCDIIFAIGAGDSFADIYGKNRLIIQVFANLLAKFYRKSLILSPQTIGPFNSKISKLLGRIGLSVATRIYARDTLSTQCLEQLGYRNKSEEVIDVAFALPFNRPSHQNKTLKIGINVSGLLYNGGYNGRNEFGLTVDYPALVKGACEYFLAQPNIEIYFVPHVISETVEVEDDLRVSQQLHEQYPRILLAPRFHSATDAKSFIAGIDFFTGARMHACIAAFSSGISVLPMAYSRKFNGLFESLSYPHVLDCLTLDTPSALNKLAEEFEHREQLISKIKTGNILARKKLDIYIDQVSSFLATL